MSTAKTGTSPSAPASGWRARSFRRASSSMRPRSKAQRRGCPSRDDVMPQGSGGRGKGGAVRGEDDVGELEGSVTPAAEALVERATEGV